MTTDYTTEPETGHKCQVCRRFGRRDGNAVDMLWDSPGFPDRWIHKQCVTNAMRVDAWLWRYDWDGTAKDYGRSVDHSPNQDWTVVDKDGTTYGPYPTLEDVRAALTGVIDEMVDADNERRRKAYEAGEAFPAVKPVQEFLDRLRLGTIRRVLGDT